MFKTVMLTCLLLIAGVLTLYSTGQALDRATLTLDNQGQVNTLDPQQMSWSSDIRICLNIWPPRPRKISSGYLISIRSSQCCPSIRLTQHSVSVS